MGHSNLDEVYEYFKSNGNIIGNISENNVQNANERANNNVLYNENADILKQLDKVIREKNIKEEEYKQKMLNTLISIEKNTESLKNIVELIKNSNENQQEIVKIISELLLLSTEASKDKAEGKYKLLMKRITNLGENADTINKLITFGTTIYSIVSKFATGQQ